MSIRGAITHAERSRVKEGKKEYTAKQRKFLTLFAKNEFKDVKECVQKAGYKSDPYTIVASLREDIVEIAKNVLVASAPEAAISVASLLSSDKPVPNANVKLQAAREVLDRAGVVKPEKHEHEHKVSGGIFLMPMKHELPTIEADYEEVYEDSEV